MISMMTVLGIIAILVGLFTIFSSVTDKLPPNPFQQMLGWPRIRQRAGGIIAGVGFCAAGAVMLLVASGSLVPN
jgi:hypothetical protein